MQNINDYCEASFRSAFAANPIAARLAQDFDYVSYNKFFFLDPVVVQGLHWREVWRRATSRQQMATRTNPSCFSAVPFYYLQFLLDRNPSTIVDLGCGWNVFKRYIPNIVGIGAEAPDSEFYFADKHDVVNATFVKNHANSFESVFAICSLHFHPLRMFAKVIGDFYSMLAPGGRGWLSINIMRMVELDLMFRKHAKNFYDSDAAKTQIESYCRDQLNTMSFIKFLVVDIDFALIDEAMDGNVRLVMEKV
jgi:hypothetical protein